MRTMMRLRQTLFVFLLATGLYAQDQPANVTQACASVANLTVPKGDPSAKCEDPAGLYYGTDGAPDYAAARSCALSQWHNLKRPLDTLPLPDERVIMPIATLVMIYTNGNGVPSNVDLAIHIVCVDDPPTASWPSFDEVIARLLQIKAHPTQKFDFCSSGIDFWKSVGYECLGIQEKLEENQHMAPLSKLMTTWTSPQKAAFAKMMKSRSTFVSQERDAETTGGTGVGGQMMEAEHDLNLNLIDSTIRFDTGHLPSFTHQDYVDSDKKLNLTYNTILSNLSGRKKEDYCKSPEMIRATERAWIAYRDDWVAFARLRWPQVSADSWLTLLTKERTDQLGDISECEL
jgi:uncharacterized protein YecT (DUF1311 family)